MADTDILQVIAEARVDARSLSEFVWKPASFMVTRRLAPAIHTLEYYLGFFEASAVRLDAKVASFDATLVQKTADAQAIANANAVAVTARAETIVRNTLEDIINSSGFAIVDSFEVGATITKRNEVLRHTVTGKLYRWGGDLPKVVPVSSTPASSGGFGAAAWLEVNDAVLSQELSSDNGYRKVANQMAANAYGIPSPLENITVSAEDYAVVDYVNDKLWANKGGNLYNSTNMGVTYNLVISGKTCNGMMATNDGEMLFMYADHLEKSTGWSVNPQTATWREVVRLTPQTNAAYFLRFGLDGDGTKFIVTHYGTMPLTSKVWVSTDNGSTFAVKLDPQALYPAETSHMHGVCYDKWADRFYLSYAHGDKAGVYYSDNDGTNWVKVKEYSYTQDGVTATFTTMTATDFGIVCGTDYTPNGVYIIRRSKNPDDIKFEFAGLWDLPLASEAAGSGGLLGFADRGFRDPDTGIVYIGFKSDLQSVEAVIMACGSGGASVVLSSGLVAGSSYRYFNVIAAKGKLKAVLLGGTTNKTVTADLSKHTMSNYTNQGNILTKTFAGRTSVAVGRAAEATADNSIAIGVGAKANQPDATGKSAQVIIGYKAKSTGQKSVAIGANTRSSGSSIVIGDNVKIGADDFTSITKAISIGVGSHVSDNGNVAIGGDARCASNSTTAIGFNCTALFSGGTAIGAYSTLSANNTTSVGAGATSNAFGSSALGYDSVADGSYDTSVGAGAKSTGGGYTTLVGAAATCLSNGTAVGASANISATGRGSSVFGKSAKATLANGVALGADAQTNGADCVSIGAAATTSASYAIAIGTESKATHQDSIVLGRMTSSTRIGGMTVGNRDIESTKAGGKIYLKSPNGTSYAIGVGDDGLLTATPV